MWLKSKNFKKLLLTIFIFHFWLYYLYISVVPNDYEITEDEDSYEITEDEDEVLLTVDEGEEDIGYQSRKSSSPSPTGLGKPLMRWGKFILIFGVFSAHKFFLLYVIKLS